MTLIGVILSGCGVFDGSEIHESVACMYALARAGAKYKCMAPNIPQMHVVNHYSGAPEDDGKRNVLRESARIARGDILDLASVEIAQYDGLIFPGGFGAAKNLCDFATEGKNCEVNPQVEALIMQARAARLPMAFLCISPVIIARLLGKNTGVKVTVGDDREASQAITDMGAVHVDCQVGETLIDEDQRIISSPAYMKADNIIEVFDDVTACVHALLDMIGRVKSVANQS
jgi:enhancing lycopene biosynthesis protein 2